MAKREVLRIVFCGLVSLSPIQATQQSVEPTAGTFTISGRVINSRGETPTDLTFTIGHDDGDGFSGGGGPLEADGTFTVRDLTPARYVLQAGPPSEALPAPGFEGGFAVVDVTTADVTGVLIRTHPTVSVKGRVRFESDAADAVRPTIYPSAWLALNGVGIGAGTQSTQVAEDGSFALHNVFGPRVIRSAYMSSDARSPWWEGPVLLDGRDITNVPTEFERYPNGQLELVFTRHPTGLWGTALDIAGLPSPNAHVIVFAADRDLWQPWASTTNVVRTNEDGRFYLAAPAGRYLAVALPDETFPSRSAAMRDFPTLSRLAEPVTIAADRPRGVTLTTRNLPKPAKPR